MTWTKEQAKRYARDWYKANRERCIAVAQRRHKENPERRRKSWVKHRLKTYGLSIAEYDRIREQQAFRCAICLIPEIDAPKGRLVVDHCHSTTRVRGLLCNNCNAILGMASDNIEVLIDAIAYLR